MVKTSIQPTEIEKNVSLSTERLKIQPSDQLSHDTPTEMQSTSQSQSYWDNPWWQVLGAFCLNLNTWGLLNAYGVYQTFYQLELFHADSSSTISWIGSTQAAFLFFTSIIVGPIFDAGYLRSLLWSGTILTVLGAFMTSLCKEYWQSLLAQGIAMGIGFGLLYLPAPAIVSQVFDSKRSLAMGISSAGAAIGGIIYPIMFTQLEPRLGFEWAARVIAFTILGTSLIPIIVMKSNTTSTKRRNILDPSAFRDVPYMMFNLGLVFGYMGLYIIFNYIQLYAILRRNLSSNVQNYLLIIINAASLLGRVVLGYVADKVGSINVQASVALVCTLLTFCLISVRTLPAFVIYSLLYGFFAGAFMGLPAAGVARLSPDHSKIGTRLGMTLAFVGFGVLVSNPIAGAILGKEQNWFGLIGWCGALLAASSLSMMASGIAKVGLRLRVAI